MIFNKQTAPKSANSNDKFILLTAIKHPPPQTIENNGEITYKRCAI